MAYKNLVASIIKCLKQLLEQDNLSDDARESLEVSIQCLESAYGVDMSNAMENFDLLKLYNATQQHFESKNSSELTAEVKMEAEKLKNEGNALMKNEKYHEALLVYSKAIELDGENAVFYCNRAAVYSKLENYQNAIKDCHTALSIDRSYSKAYGRLGLAYASLNKYKEAKESYEKALALEPDNESFKINLKIAEEKLRQQNSAGNESTSSIANMDLSSLLSNPALMNMARQMLSDPTMQNMMSSLISGNIEQGGRMGALIEAGQQLAQQMQNSNPELIEFLRRQTNGNTNEADFSDKNNAS